MGEFSMQEAIQAFLSKSKLKGGIQSIRIEEIWLQAMGATIAKYTENVQLVNQTLYITTTVAPLRNELIYQKNKIIERVNEALNEKLVKEVVIK